MKTFNHESGKHFIHEGCSIYYEEIGDKAKPALLFLHGGMQHIEDFNSIVSFFTDDHYVIGMDSRGHGKSTMGDEPLTFERLQQDVEALVQHLRLREINLVGFSDGGIIAYRLAAARKINIKKIIAIGTTWHIRDGLLTKDLFLGMKAETVKSKFPQLYNRYYALNPEPDFDKFLKALIPMWLDETTAGYPNDNITNIECPVLMIRGDNDHLFTRASVVESATKIKGSTLLNIPYAGHMAYSDQTQICVQVIKQFLEKP
jgi:pimeloyl-ACP methyl ester carboxylesterase